MKRYIFFCLFAFAPLQSANMKVCLEIAINTQGRVITDQNESGCTRMFVPITVYKNGKLICGTFIPWIDISDADDGHTVTDQQRGSTKLFLCNQHHSSHGSKTFKQAFIELISKNTK